MYIRERTLGGWGGRATKVARATESVSISRKSPITTIANYNKKSRTPKSTAIIAGCGAKTPIATCDRSG